MPNPEEMALIGKLTKSNYVRVTEDSSTPLDEEELNPVCSDRLADLNLRPIPGVTPSANCVQRRKRQADNVPSDSTLYQEHMHEEMEQHKLCAADNAFDLSTYRNPR